METKKITVGSKAFFSSIKEFKPSSGEDELYLLEKGNGYEYIQTIKVFNKYIIKIVRRPKEDLIKYALNSSPAMVVGKFLVPEFANEIGLTIDDLKRLQPLIESLEKKHQYEKIIFESYIANNNFTLTEEQLQEAYSSYMTTRSKK